MKNNFITKIIGATLAFAMMIGGAVGINAAKEATEVNAADGFVSKSAETLATENEWVQSAGSTIGTKFNSFALDDYITVSFAGTGNTATYWTDVRVYGTKSKSDASVTFTGASGVTIKTITLTFTTQKSPTFTPSIATGEALTVNANSKTITMNGSSSGNPQIRITNFECEYEYTPAKNLSSITLSGTYPTSFEQGDTFSHEGMTVTATYSDASTADVTSSATFTGYDMSTAGDQTVTVSYTESGTTKTATYDINVAAATMYTVGETIINGSLSSTASIKEGNALNIDIIPSAKYSLPATLGTVTMGGNALTAGSGYTYNSTTGAFAIASVTGNVVINAECTKTRGYWADNPYSVAEAIDAIDASSGTSEVYTRGIVCGYYNSGFSETPKLYNGKLSFYFSVDGSEGQDGDGATRIEAYNCYKASGSTTFANISEVPEIGDTVIVYGDLTKFNSTYETTNCYLESVTPPSYTITYNANGATSGNVPVDGTSYLRHSNATLASNTGLLAKTNYEFNGWNTKADPTADGAEHYNAGATFNNITSNLTLYAEWLSIEPSITVQANLSGYTGQSVDLDFSYGNIANESNLSVVAADSKVTVGDLIADGGVGAVTITFNTAGETSLSFRNNGEELATCAVVVNQSEISITGLSPRGSVQIGATLNLGSQVTINHSGIYSGDVVWESSDTDVATVSDSGVVTGKAIGQTTITVTSFDKLDVYQSCVVNVYKGPQVNTLNLKIASYVATGDHLVTWTCDYAVLTNTSDPEAGASGTKATNYLGGDANHRTSSRMYAGNIMTITPNSGYAISSVVFTATSNGYADALKDSEWTNATATSSGANTTIVPTNGTTAFSAVIGGTCGFETVKIYISPASYLQAASTIKTISGVESNGGATVTNVALRVGGVIPVSTWNQINSNWAITDFGIMFARGSMLTARSLDSLEKVFRNDPADVAMVHRGAVGTPNANGDDYIFTARLNLEEVDYDEVFYAAPFIVAGGEYYFLQEMHYSVRTLAEECLTSGESTLSQAALTTLKGNN